MQTNTLQRLLSCALLLGVMNSPCTASPMPPERIELTSKRMKELGFSYTAWRKKDFSYIELTYPIQIQKNLQPDSIQLATFNRKGDLVQFSESEPSGSTRSFLTRFNHKELDVSARVLFCERNTPACINYEIESVSRFVNDNGETLD
jgi:hypothetical protein